MADVLIDRVPSPAARASAPDLVDTRQPVQEASQRRVGPGDVEVTERCSLDVGLGCDHADQHRLAARTDDPMEEPVCQHRPRRP